MSNSRIHPVERVQMTLHPEKTRLLEFGRYAVERAGSRRGKFNRRTRGNRLTWERYIELLRRHPLLPPRIRHVWTDPESPA